MLATHALTSQQSWMGRIAPGEDIIKSLEAFCGEKGIQAAWVQCIGAVSKATISYYEQREHKYYLKELTGDYEIVSCYGNISMKDGQPFGHLHIVLSDTDYACFGGHLMPGTVSVFACEFVVHAFDTPNGPEPLFCRMFDEQTGLALWPDQSA
jgi:predicted DNA-binding protein with PD1-like motif